MIALIVCVDDMIITRDDAEEITRLQEQLSNEFEMKNLGDWSIFWELNWFDRNKAYFHFKGSKC